MSREERISGRYGAGRPRGYDTLGYGDSDRDEPRVACPREDYSHYAGGISRGHGGHRTTGAEVYEDHPDFSDDDSWTGEPASRRSGGARDRCRVVRGDHYEQSSDDDDSLGGESAGPRYEGSRTQRGQGPSYSHGTGSRYTDTSYNNDSTEESPSYSRGIGSRYTDTSYNNDSTEESTDDESAHGARGVRSGLAASGHHGAPSSRRRRRQFSPHPRRSMRSSRRSGSVDSSDSEAELGGCDPSLRQYGGQCATGSYGRYDSIRDSDRRRY